MANWSNNYGSQSFKNDRWGKQRNAPSRDLDHSWRSDENQRPSASSRQFAAHSPHQRERPGQQSVPTRRGGDSWTPGSSPASSSRRRQVSGGGSWRPGDSSSSQRRQRNAPPQRSASPDREERSRWSRDRQPSSSQSREVFAAPVQRPAPPAGNWKPSSQRGRDATQKPWTGGSTGAPLAAPPVLAPAPSSSGPSSVSSDLSPSTRQTSVATVSPSPPREGEPAQQQAVAPSAPAPNRQVEAEVGRIMVLPSRADGRDCPFYSAEFERQPHVNGKAGGHPALVWDMYVRADGEPIARCLPVTSFRDNGLFGMSIEEKYDGKNGRDAWRHIARYLPIDHEDRTTSGFNQPVVRLQQPAGSFRRHDMKCQSYVHLDHFYEVEARFLKAGDFRGLRVETPSLAVVIGKLMDFCDGKIFCAEPKGLKPVVSPLFVDRGMCGRPRDLSAVVEQIIADGRMLEEMRLRETGTQYVTGTERAMPRRQDPEQTRWIPRAWSAVQERMASSGAI